MISPAFYSFIFFYFISVISTLTHSYMKPPSRFIWTSLSFFIYLSFLFASFFGSLCSLSARPRLTHGPVWAEPCQFAGSQPQLWLSAGRKFRGLALGQGVLIVLSFLACLYFFPFLSVYISLYVHLWFSLWLCLSIPRLKKTGSKHSASKCLSISVRSYSYKCFRLLHWEGMRVCFSFCSRLDHCPSGISNVI